MNINKIKNFNQIVLAIAISLAVLLISIFIFRAVSEIFSGRSDRYRDDNAQIISNEKAEQNYQSNIRTQQVSFEEIQLVDSINMVYLIPVSQSALKIEEYTGKYNKSSDGSMGLLHINGPYSDFYYGDQSYNNALIYDARDGSTSRLFNSRISINNIYIEKIAGKAYVLFAATDKDTSKDGILNQDDAKTLYLYSVAEKSLSEIKNKNTDFISFTIVSGNELIIINYGLDKNKDGKYNWDEPQAMKVYSIRDKKLNDLVLPAMVSELQNTLDGKK